MSFLFKRLPALLLSTLAGFGIWSGTAQADALDNILDAGIIKIAVPDDFPPFGERTEGKLEGYDIDVANLIAEGLGVKLKPVTVKSVNRVPFLMSGEVDLVVSCLGINPQRAKAITFSQPYGPFFSGVFGAPEVTVQSVADLAGKKVAVTKDTLEDLELSKLAPEGTEIIRFDANEDTIQAYLSEQAELLLTGNPVAATLAKKYPYKPVETKFILRNSPCSIGVRYGEPRLLNWINAFVFTKKLDGELDRLARQWFGEPLPLLPTL